MKTMTKSYLKKEAKEGPHAKMSKAGKKHESKEAKKHEVAEHKINPLAKKLGLKIK